jgi:hypothetical protein
MVSATETAVNDGTLLAVIPQKPMKSPHILMSLMSLGLMLGLARAVQSIDVRHEDGSLPVSEPSGSWRRHHGEAEIRPLLPSERSERRERIW